MIPIEITDIIFQFANNKCHICNNYCKIPYKKLSKFYFCNEFCYKFLY